MPPSVDSLFPTVIAGLERFRDRVTGDDGSYRVALLAPGQASAVLSIAIDILDLVYDLLSRLRDGLADFSERLVSIDAVVAMVETVGSLLEGLGEVLDPATLPLPIPGLAEAQGGAADGFGEVGELLANAPAIDVLPGPETFSALENVLRDLVGPVDEEYPEADALGQLLTQLHGGSA
ncbi:MAG: hypothetical protein AAF799_34625 [Myxococcota bacterium]